MLARLDVLDFQDEHEWRQLMFACHHATGGDGEAEFVAWSAGDPNFAGDSASVVKRWRSCRDKPNAITAGTLRHILREHGAGDVIPPRDVPDDEFPDDVRDVRRATSGARNTSNKHVRDANASHLYQRPRRGHKKTEGKAMSIHFKIHPDSAKWLRIVTGDDAEPDAQRLFKLNEIDVGNIDEMVKFVNNNGKPRIMRWGKSGFDPKVRIPEFMTVPDFKALMQKSRGL